jgi:RNA polymerase sigma factor (sigma-70 family)
MAPSHEFHSDPSVRTIIKKKARQLCRRSECSRSDFDDLCQEMHLHLLRKAHLFDPARACPMAFAQQAINSYAAMHLRAARRTKRRGRNEAISIDGIHIVVSGIKVPLADALDEGDQLRSRGGERITAIERIDLRDAICAAIRSMTPEQQRLFVAVCRHRIRGARRQRDLWNGRMASFRRIHAAVDELREIRAKFGISSP